jgi:hypothetical protein
MVGYAALRSPSAHTYRLLIFKERVPERRVFPRLASSSKERDYDGLLSTCQVGGEGNFALHHR